MQVVNDISIQNSNVPILKCGNCQKVSEKLLRCSRCQLERYCGLECQKAHWQTHRKACLIKKKNLPENGQTVSNQVFKEIETPIPGLRLIHNFIPDSLHDQFVEQMQTGIPEKNKGHYDGYCFPDDGAFTQVFNPLIEDCFKKLKQLQFFSGEKKPIKLACTLVGYEKNGFIDRHIDSPLLSGGTVVILSFNSPVVVNFYSEKKTQGQQHKIFVPPKSMYAISDEARYGWSHAILSDETTYEGQLFERKVRYAMLLTLPGPLYSGTELLDY